MTKELVTLVLRRKQAVLISGDFNDHVDVNPVTETAIANLIGLGFVPTEELNDVLHALQQADIKVLYPKLVSAINVVYSTSSRFNNRPFFPLFPDKIMELDEAELYFETLLHYLTHGEYIPSDVGDHKNIDKYFETINVARELRLFNYEDLSNLISEIIRSNGSLSDQDKEDLKIIATHEPGSFIDVVELCHESMNIKENIMFIASILYDIDIEVADWFTQFHLKTATDVLRFAVALSGGDISLATNTKFINIRRRTRKMIMDSMNQMSIGSVEEDIARNREKWKRLAEVLHPGEYIKVYPELVELFRKLRNGEHLETFNSKVEGAILDKNLDEAIDILVTRPGELMRRIDKLTRESNPVQLEKLKLAMAEVAHNVATPVLLQLLGHFKSRTHRPKRRMFLPKGSIAKAYIIDNKLEPLDLLLVGEFISIISNALRKKFSSLPSLGNVYIDHRLKKIPVPLAQRSASSQARTLPRGSKVPFNATADILRLFVHWKQGEEDTDIDLSAVFHDSEWEAKHTLWYAKLRSKDLNASHSGDYISSGPEGATEYIDIDINRALEKGIKYVSVPIINFSGLKFTDMKECFAGFMVRDADMGGDVFEYKTVEHKFDLTGDSSNSLPMILDLVNREIVWLDLNLPGSAGSNVITEGTAINELISSAMEDTKCNLFDLFFMHTMARGKIVSSAEEADIVFGFKGDVTPYDISKILADYVV